MTEHDRLDAVSDAELGDDPRDMGLDGCLGILPRWTGPTLALGWFLGATPILGDGGFLIVGVAFVAVAIGLRRETSATVAEPVGIETSLTA